MRRYAWIVKTGHWWQFKRIVASNRVDSFDIAIQQTKDFLETVVAVDPKVYVSVRVWGYTPDYSKQSRGIL